MKKILLFILFLLLIGSGIYSDFFEENLKVQEEKCVLEKIGTTIKAPFEKEVPVYRYCLDIKKTNKVYSTSDFLIFSRLVQNIKPECLWDGGSCIYKSKSYQIISCHPLFGKENVIITTIHQDSEKIIENYCMKKDE